ncbi:hypothetical protein [Luteolibacter luteus]|uniref:Uncharacterized protein n=1 Tax=Luteolibacter luteus TaxID=2728835 RepID=A0A858RMF4_9BACT|nr:hypothetical protein [Luteolibacter luteus]QJE97638.1 hypothetical protein HHL09_18260 [Luteolibacter luteus]
MTSSRHRQALAQYEDRFGSYSGEKYISPSECPEDRRALVAEIEVSAAAVLIADHLAPYAEGIYPERSAEKLEHLYSRVRNWDPHLPRK